MAGRGDNVTQSKHLPVALASSSRQPCFLLTEKSLGNVPSLESLRLLETRKGKIYKSKQKTEYVKGTQLLFISNTPEQIYLKGHVVFLSTAQGIKMHRFCFGFFCYILPRTI